MLTSEQAFQKAKDSGGTKKLRTISIRESRGAFSYAYHIDKTPHDDTRKATLAKPEWAYMYALEIDKTPREDTRNSTCDDPRWAYMYALYVDKTPREDTYRAVLDSKYQKSYEKNLNPSSLKVKEDLRSIRSKEQKRNNIIC